jgi:hypothetical protein
MAAPRARPCKASRCGAGTRRRPVPFGTRAKPSGRYRAARIALGDHEPGLRELGRGPGHAHARPDQCQGRKTKWRAQARKAEIAKRMGDAGLAGGVTMHEACRFGLTDKSQGQPCSRLPSSGSARQNAFPVSWRGCGSNRFGPQEAFVPATHAVHRSASPLYCGQGEMAGRVPSHTRGNQGPASRAYDPGAAGDAPQLRVAPTGLSRS